MEGPTVVSAMIHAATLVLAGIIWSFKVVTWYWYPYVFCSIICAGCLSYSIVSYCCIDVKRCVAYSTGWHVSVIVLLHLVGVSWLLSHLVIHALFKSAIFLLMGAIIHAYGQQDSRLAGSSVWAVVRVISLCWCIYSSIGWAYAGVFFTKKVLCDSAWAAWVSLGGSCVLGLVVIGSAITICYSVALSTQVLAGSPSSSSWHDESGPGGVGNGSTMICHLGGLVIVDAGTLAVSSDHCCVRSGLVVLFVGSAYLVLLGLGGVLGGGLLTAGSPTRPSGPAWVRSWDPGGSRSLGLFGRGDPHSGTVPASE